jgi:hypothetical protein
MPGMACWNFVLVEGLRMAETCRSLILVMNCILGSAFH